MNDINKFFSQYSPAPGDKDSAKALTSEGSRKPSVSFTISVGII